MVTRIPRLFGFLAFMVLVFPDFVFVFAWTVITLFSPHSRFFDNTLGIRLRKTLEFGVLVFPYSFVAQTVKVILVQYCFVAWTVKVLVLYSQDQSQDCTEGWAFLRSLCVYFAVRFGVSYPTNGVKECYTKALEDRGLTDACFSSSSQKAFSLGGMYRRYAAFFSGLLWAEI